MTSAALEGKTLPMNVMIIGGSLTGLMHGITIKRLGHNVRILDQTISSIRTDQAAGMGTGPQGLEFFKQHDLYPHQYSFDCPGMQFLDKNANIKRLGFCPDPPTRSENEGTAKYEVCKKATNVFYNGQLVKVEFSDISNGQRGFIEADLVIVADGANSTIRQILLPDVRYQYSGYVAWRGTVLEEEVSEETRKLFDTRCNVFTMSRGYAVGYAMPGIHGNLAVGHRLLNWVWYFNCPKDTPAFNQNMTDVNGYTHRNTLAAGKMHPEIWQKHKNHARQVLNPPFLELINKTAQPFISTVNDCAATKASFFDGKVLLVGEALTLLRPHTGMSFNHAAVNCLLLQRVLKGEMTTVQWEREVLRYAEKTRLLSICVGSYYQFGLLSSTFLLSVIRYLFALLRQGLFSIWALFRARVR